MSEMATEFGSRAEDIEKNFNIFSNRNHPVHHL